VHDLTLHDLTVHDLAELGAAQCWTVTSVNCDFKPVFAFG
jgi:hypothetical protein